MSVRARTDAQLRSAGPSAELRDTVNTQDPTGRSPPPFHVKRGAAGREHGGRPRRPGVSTGADAGDLAYLQQQQQARRRQAGAGRSQRQMSASGSSSGGTMASMV